MVREVMCCFTLQLVKGLLGPTPSSFRGITEISFPTEVSLMHKDRQDKQFVEIIDNKPSSMQEKRAILQNFEKLEKGHDFLQNVYWYFTELFPNRSDGNPIFKYLNFLYLADPGEARCCSTNSFVIQ